MTNLLTLARRTSALAGLAILATTVTLAAQTAAPAPPKTPTEAFLGYRAALMKVKTVDQLKPWLAKAAIAQIDGTPAAERQMILEFIKDMSTAYTNVKVVKETITGDTATLEVTATITGDKSTKKATVAIVREDGVWKFVKESWGSL